MEHQRRAEMDQGQLGPDQHVPRRGALQVPRHPALPLRLRPQYRAGRPPDPRAGHPPGGPGRAPRGSAGPRAGATGRDLSLWFPGQDGGTAGNGEDARGCADGKNGRAWVRTAWQNATRWVRAAWQSACPGRYTPGQRVRSESGRLSVCLRRRWWCRGAVMAPSAVYDLM